MRAAVLVFVLATTSTAHAGGAFLIPPIEVAMGANAPVGLGVITSTATELQIGVHWASLAWKPTRFDIGVGYTGSQRDFLRGHAIERGFAPNATFSLHGGYLHLATTIAGQRHWRTWIAARGELLRGDDGMRELSALGGALRIATELYASGAAGDRNVFGIGTLAIGLYVEASYRDVPHELGATGLVTGISARIPFLFGGT